MTLSPPSDPWYIGQSDSKSFKLKEYMDDVYNQSITVNQSFWSEADIDYRFYAGDQSIFNDIYGNLPAYQKKQFNFNRIRRIVNMITGYQRQHRKSLTATPIENSSEETANLYSQIFFWMNQTENLYETISESFLGSVITGMNFIGVDLDFNQDPISGDLKFRNVSYNSYLTDPFFRKHDLSDCDYFWERKYVSRDEAFLMFPKARAEIEAVQPNNGSKDGRFYFLPESYSYGTRDLLALDLFYYRDTRRQKVIVDLESGETRQWEGSKEELDLFLSTYPQVELKETYVPTVNAAYLIQDTVVYHGSNPVGIDNYPYVGVFCYYTPSIPYYPYRVQGVVRSIRDSQYLYNRRKIIELDIMESQVTSGFKYKEDALVNPEDIYLQGQGRGVAIKSEAQMSDVEKIEAPNIPQSMIELSKILGEEIMTISGVNEELLGAATDDKAGILAMLRQGAGLITLQQLYDQLDMSQKLLGGMIIDIVQANWAPGKIQKITKEKPTQEFFTKNWDKYNVVVEEGLNTATQRQMQFVQLLNLRELGVPVPSDVLLEASTIQDKKKLIEAVKSEEEKAQQMQQQEIQVQQQINQARIAELHAKSEANLGLRHERDSRVLSNIGLMKEREMESQKNLDQATLDIVKAIKELDGIDMQHMAQALQIIQSLKATEEAGATDKDDTVDIVGGIMSPKDAVGDAQEAQSTQSTQQPPMGQT